MGLFSGTVRPLDTDMSGRTCLVTGATDGHGRAMAKFLAARGADVVLHARNEEKARRVQDEIAQSCRGKTPEILLADLASRDAIESAVERYRGSGRPLHLLVNNAGLVGLERRTSDAGLELTFAVNYLAMFQMTIGLLPIMRECGPARIVNISSDTYRIASHDFENLQLERNYSMVKAYGQSKLAILYFTIELARRLAGTGVTVNAVDPGPVASNIGADNPGIAYRLLGPLIRGLFPSSERAARTALWVATDKALESSTGGYYRSLSHRENPLDFDDETSRQLWQTSLDLLDIKSDPLD
jgi:NAD(P)-dependent dehydrogenase (short-subunit alcohol dehydrogenase family)